LSCCVIVWLNCHLLIIFFFSHSRRQCHQQHRKRDETFLPKRQLDRKWNANLQIYPCSCAIHHSSLCNQLCLYSGKFDDRNEPWNYTPEANHIFFFIHLLKMAVKLWGSKTPGNAQDLRDITLLKNKKKVIKMLVIVVVSFCVAWFPLQTYNIVNVTWLEVNEYRYIHIIWFCCDWLAMSNSCYNPFIYGIYNVSAWHPRDY
jgi:hypothetical protein